MFLSGLNCDQQGKKQEMPQIASSNRANSAPQMPNIFSSQSVFFFPLFTTVIHIPAIKQKMVGTSDVPSRTFSQLSNCKHLLVIHNVSAKCLPLLQDCSVVSLPWAICIVIRLMQTAQAKNEKCWCIHICNMGPLQTTERQQGLCTCAQLTSTCLSLCIDWTVNVNTADVKDPGMEKNTRSKRLQWCGGVELKRFELRGKLILSGWQPRTLFPKAASVIYTKSKEKESSRQKG